ncbi:MAG: NB-ARC domain-containing protein [Roseiflexaceae bacterium]|nr:NB-ARC domain-containing protein [Roseiflexaceae bacterium]
MSQRSELFGRLLRGAINSIAVYEGKTAPLIEDELGSQIGLAGSAIQRYKAGHLPPEERTVQIIAEAAIRRGFLGREWLERFLRAARYADTERLLNLLCPMAPERVRPPRAYHNLPAPIYSQFIMRPEPYAEVLDGLGKRSSAVLIIGLGGNGKTSLAREIAGFCLRNTNREPSFDAIVWVSDKDKPGTTNLSTVLDEIARTLDYPGFTQFAHEEKRREVEQLLRRQRVLVVIDNFETITDTALLAWLLDLPEPSKALITTREYRREFRRGGWPVELRGMSETEAFAFVEERLRLLRIDRLASDHTQLEPLIAITGGNPKALELALGLIKYERRSLRQVIDDLYAARGDLFADLFVRAWALLDEATQHSLLAMSLFPISTSGMALQRVAGVSGYPFERAIERLADLALVDLQQADLNSPPRYALHPLVRAFAGARLAECPEFEQNARERWLAWYLEIAATTEVNWYDTHALAAIDPEVDNLSAAITWAVQAERDSAVLRLSATLGYYYYVRGWWSAQLLINDIRLATARRLGNQLEEGYTLLNMLRIMALQGRIMEAQHLAEQVEAILHTAVRTDRQRCSFLHGLAIFAFANGNVEYGRGLLREVLRLCGDTDSYKYVRARNWMADSLLQAGDVAEAERLFEESLAESLNIRYYRSATFCQLRLALAAMQRGDDERAGILLDAALQRATASQDRRDLAIIKQAYAHLYTLRGDTLAARVALAEAIDLFERLGMRQELGEAQSYRIDVRSDAIHRVGTGGM